jgi:hypothetical protein
VTDIFLSHEIPGMTYLHRWYEMFLKLLNPISAIKICNFDGFALKMLINGAFLYFSMKPKNLASTLAITRTMAYIVELMPCFGQVLQQRVALTKDWD